MAPIDLSAAPFNLDDEAMAWVAATRDAFTRVREQTSAPEVVTIQLRTNERAATKDKHGIDLPRYAGHLFAEPLGSLESTIGAVQLDLGNHEAGVLAIEEHRNAEGTAQDPKAPTGYVTEAFVIEAATRAGFTLAARSDVLSNPADDRDHPFGVWTLPPNLRTAPAGQAPDPAFDSAPYAGIGESDRMALRFVKPE